MKGKSGGGYIMSDKICSSADKVLEVFLENAPMDTSHHRMVKQQNKCGYGLQGVCCRLCSNVHVVYHRRNQKVYVEQMQIQLLAGIF